MNKIILLGIVIILAFFAFSFSCEDGNKDTNEMPPSSPSPSPSSPTPTPATPTPSPSPTTTLPPIVPKPTITWSPAEIIVTISPGESKSIDVSFVANKDLNNVELFVDSKLQPYVRVSPSSFSHVKAGASNPITIIFSSPINAELGSFNGAIHIKSIGKNNKTYSHPLPITINIFILDETFQDSDLGVTFEYPSFDKPSQVVIKSEEEGITVLDIRLSSILDGLLVSHFSFAIIKNGDSLSLLDWFQQNIDPNQALFSSGVFMELRLSNGIQALVLASPIPDEHGDQYGPISMLYAISPSGETIISATLSQVHELDLRGFDSSDRLGLLMAILESFTFL